MVYHRYHKSLLCERFSTALSVQMHMDRHVEVESGFGPVTA